MKFFDLFKRKKPDICCARCKKKITEAEAQWIGNHRFCKDCARPTSAQVSQPRHSGNVTANSVRRDIEPEYPEYLITAAQQSSKIEELDHLITIAGDGYRSTSLYLHKKTNEPYIVEATLEQLGGGYFERYHSIEKAASAYIDAIASYKTEHDYATAYKLKSIFIDYKKIGRSFSIADRRFRYMAYLLVNGVEIPVKEAMLSEDKVRIPAEYLPSKQYEQYHVCPGPYEHAYDLPSELIDNVIARIIHIPGGDA